MKRNWKELHKKSLRENQPRTFRTLSRSGALSQHLQEVHQEAEEMWMLLTGQLREKNPTWTPDQIERTATEVVLHELILVRDEETMRAELAGGYTD